MAEKTALKMKPGTYYAGINRPWYAGQDAVRKEVEKRLGVTDVRFFSRKKTQPPVNPKIDPRYSDGWDEWISARYDGPEKLLPVDRLWNWVVRSDTAKPPAALPPAPGAAPEEPEASAAAGGLVVVGGLGALAFAVWYARR